MKMIVRRTVLAVCTLVLALILPTAASAACTGFDDVPESADCYESVIYLAECEIAAGTENDCFSPKQLITVEQWAVMLCRAYGVETIGDSWQDVGRSSVVEAYRQGWLNETALSAPNIQLCRGALLKSAFAAAKIPVYDSVLYTGGVSLPDYENCIRIGKELQLCGEEDDANEIVTRRDAAMLLHAILTRAFAVTAPAAPVTLVNAAGVNINDYLLALRQVPEPMLAAFEVAGWTYRIDFNYISELSKQLNMSCIVNIETYKLPHRILRQRSTKNLFVTFEIFLVSIFRLVEKADVHCNFEWGFGIRCFMANAFQPLPVLCHKRRYQVFSQAQVKRRVFRLIVFLLDA